MSDTRRNFLKLMAAAGAVGGLNAPIARALALPAARRTGTIQDVEHIVVLMQENRSFDHYYGSMRGVRGFGDPRPMLLPGGRSVWEQPLTRGAESAVLPFRLNAGEHNANAMQSLDHSWKGSHALWKNSDAWIEKKTALTMGYHTRDDIPFYYALADAFTLCDGYHASLHGPTNPNRLYMYAGTSGLSVGDTGPQLVANADDNNWTGDASRDDPKFKGLTWTTYAERLQQAGISWRVYQEYDNFGDNTLSSFANFRGLDPSSELYKRGRSIVAGSTRENAAASEGEHLVDAIRRDVMNDTLPQVSYIAAPYKLCEHPEASALEYGQFLTARILGALTANPAVWGKTVFLINYDENDGFFDHVPPVLPALNRSMGQSTVDVAGESFHGEPVGLGLRVPLTVVSPWSKGGWVNSEVFDHTSIIRFIEQRFGVIDTNITPWRRAVTGDLTSAFDFAHPDRVLPTNWPETANSKRLVESGRVKMRPAPPLAQDMPHQESGRRPARALPYNLAVDGARNAAQGFDLRITNTGKAGAGFNVYAPDDHQGPWFYTVEAGKSLADTLPLPASGEYWYRVHGPNGFLREFKGSTSTHMAQPRIEAGFARRDDKFEISVIAAAFSGCDVTIEHLDYLNESVRVIALQPGQRKTSRIDLKPSDHWYDIIVRIGGSPTTERLAGHAETGRSSASDPAYGRRAT